MLRIQQFSYTQLSGELNCMSPAPGCGSCPAGNSGKTAISSANSFPHTTHGHTGTRGVVKWLHLFWGFCYRLSLVENGRFNHRPSLLSCRRQFSTCFCPKQRQMLRLPRNFKELGGEPCGVCFGQGCLWKRPSRLSSRAGARKQTGGRGGLSAAAGVRGFKEEPGERDFSPEVCWKDLGSANKESFSQYVSQDTQFSSSSAVGNHIFHPIQIWTQL